MGLLAGGNRHGYDLKHEHDVTFAAAKPLAFGQVYATIDRLVKKGHVEAVEVDAGRIELKRWLSEVDSPVPHVANPFAVKATIAMLVGDRSDAIAYLAAQRTAHVERMRHFTRLKTDPATSLTELLAADYAIAHLDADLAWLDLALDRLAAFEVPRPAHSVEST